MVKKNWKNEVVPFIVAFIILLIIEQYFNKGNLWIIALSIFWKLSLILLIRLLYIQYIQPKK